MSKLPKRGIYKMSLQVKIGGDATQLKRTFDGVVKNAQGVGKTIQKAIVGPLLGLAGGIGATAIVKSVVDAGDQIGKMSKRLGLSYQDYQMYASMANRSGTSIEAIGNGIKKLKQNISQGTEKNNVFKEIGLSLDDLKGKDTNEQLELITKSLQGIKDPTERSAKAMKIFGQVGFELGPLIDSYQTLRDEVKATSETMSDKSVEDAMQIKKSLDDISKSLKVALVESGALNWVTEIASGMNDIVRAAKLLQDYGGKSVAENTASLYLDEVKKNIFTMPADILSATLNALPFVNDVDLGAKMVDAWDADPNIAYLTREDDLEFVKRRDAIRKEKAIKQKQQDELDDLKIETMSFVDSEEPLTQELFRSFENQINKSYENKDFKSLEDILGRLKASEGFGKMEKDLMAQSAPLGGKTESESFRKIEALRKSLFYQKQDYTKYDQDVERQYLKIFKDKKDALRKRKEAFDDSIEKLNFEIEIQDLKNKELEKEAFLREEIRKIVSRTGELEEEEKANLREKLSVLFDLKKQDVEERGLSDLMQKETDLMKYRLGSNNQYTQLENIGALLGPQTNTTKNRLLDVQKEIRTVVKKQSSKMNEIAASNEIGFL
jgi:hypothetical protein